MTPPVPSYLSPRRWRWIQFITRHQEVRFLYWPPRTPTGYRNLRMHDRAGYEIGRLVWVVCDDCRVASINKISIVFDHHRQGLGRRLVRRALVDGPGYRWQTTFQSPEAKKFFPALQNELGVELPEHGGVCAHLKSGRRPWTVGDQPRAALDRTV
ncbi:hypothetical protein ACIREE_42055 [Streptomyces sp. NPDC102467]|uniref:hypothetical protein n=1 Tax=Streptomyces sp. NPDC102467 TaxID=3366179 RepID=UPI003810E908